MVACRVKYRAGVEGIDPTVLDTDGLCLNCRLAWRPAFGRDVLQGVQQAAVSREGSDPAASAGTRVLAALVDL